MTHHGNIGKWNPEYALLKHYVKLNFRLYFRNIYIKGKHNIPDDAPVIFAPNHQNALMDALAVLYSVSGQPVFLARADIFKNKVLAGILTFMKLMPVYRIRDGYNSLQNNESVLNKVSHILSRNGSLVIFPEGNHGERKRLRPLKKGICRMAFQAEGKNYFNLGLYIVPVGLDYENYYKFHKSLMVNFGKPIAIAPFKYQYLDNPSKAYVSLKNKIAEGLKEVMIHIDDEKHYHFIDNLREIYRKRMKEQMKLSGSSHPEGFKSDRKLVRICERKIHDNSQEVDRLSRKVREFQKYLKRLNYKPWLFEQKKHSTPGLIATFPLFVIFLPLFLYGLVNNALPFFLPGLATRKVKDPQFYSSIRNGVALVLFPLFYLIQLVIFSRFVDGVWLRPAYLVSLPVTGYAAYQYYRLQKKWWFKWRYNLFRVRQPRYFRQIHRLREEIIQTVDRWVEEYSALLTGNDSANGY
ncbi:MAG: 1-acyl-sn-glycerol-3-phosphate acyltransferase [Bacteroidales bacterium]|nr:1-acyl-sn-glycerol-3-phosphate acyltransferase [Bacteroidales bacterium]